MAPQDPSKLRLVVKSRSRRKRNSQDRLQADEQLEQRRPPPTQEKSWSQIAQGSNDQAQNKQASHYRPGSDYVNWVSMARTRRYRSYISVSRNCPCTDLLRPLHAHKHTHNSTYPPPKMRLDLTSDSDFPSLNNNPQMSGAPANQPSMWGGQAARNLGGPQRNPSASIPPSSQQDDPFSPVSRLSTSQNSFRFGSQASMGQQQPPQPTGGDEFPPLARNGNGEIGQERNASLVSAMGGMSFASQGGVGSSSTQAGRSGNGLLNAVTAQARTAETRSPVGRYCYFTINITILTIV